MPPPSAARIRGRRHPEEVPLPRAVPNRLAAALALLGAFVALALVLPAQGHAQAVTAQQPECFGHLQAGERPTGNDLDVPAEFPVEYVFACSRNILGYSIIIDREATTFETEIQVFGRTAPNGPATVPISGEAFTCEGEQPGFGIGCFSAGGRYSRGTGPADQHVIRGTLGLTDGPVCDEPRVSARLVVAPESINLTTGALLRTNNGRITGPFELGRPRGCPRSSPFAGLLAQVAELRAQRRS